MYILKFVNSDDDLTKKEFFSKSEMNEFIKENNIQEVWHQIEEVKKVIPNLKEDIKE